MIHYDQLIYFMNRNNDEIIRIEPNDIVFSDEIRQYLKKF